MTGGLDQLNEDLQDVTRIMTKNMEDLLWRGDSLDRMSTMSSSLRDESLKYRKAARQINIDALVRKWAPVGIIGLLFLFVVYWKFCASVPLFSFLRFLRLSYRTELTSSSSRRVSG